MKEKLISTLGESIYYVIQFFSEGGRDLRFCMTDDDGDYGTKKSNFFFKGGSGGAKPPEKILANLGVFFRIFVLDF